MGELGVKKKEEISLRKTPASNHKIYKDSVDTPAKNSF